MRYGTLVVVLVAGCASQATRVTDLGGDQYTMQKSSGAVLVRSDDLLRQLQQEALDYCGPRGGALAIVDSHGVDPGPPDYPSAEISFRCVRA